MEAAFFTGHRDFNQSVPINSLIAMASLQGVQNFYVGMALGTDLLAAKLLGDLQLNWTAVIPFEGHTKRWKTAQRNAYKEIIQTAKSQITIASKFSYGAYHQRNDYMMKQAQLCLAIYDGRETGGTATVIKKAIKRSLSVIIFNPQNSQFTFH